MGLSDQQIERYARQIIVPGFGGVGQERLVGSRLMLLGDFRALVPVLAYMAGAGVGEIQLMRSTYDQAEAVSLVATTLDLNPDLSLHPLTGTDKPADLVLALGIDPEARKLIESPPIALDAPALIIVHLQPPGAIAVFTNRPPCPLCAELAWTNTLLNESAPLLNINAGLVAMVAATEALKLLAYPSPCPSRILEFNGFQYLGRELHQLPNLEKCACSVRYRGDRG
jgi:hypothetical protein